MKLISARSRNHVHHRPTARKFGAIVADLHFKFADAFEIRKHLYGSHRLVPIVQAVDHECIEAASRSGGHYFRSRALRLISIPLRANAAHRPWIRSWRQECQLRKIAPIEW